MVSNQVLGARVLAGLLIVSLGAAGCSHLRHHDTDTSAPPAAVTAAPSAGATASPAAPEMTATEAAISASSSAAAPRRAPSATRVRW